MSRYRVEESTTAWTINNIYYSNGWIAGQIYWAGQPESERLKRFIEAHDEILAVLRETVRVLGARDRYDFVIKAEALIKQFDSEEAQ